MKISQATSNRIQLLRAIAIVAVVAIHVVYFAPNEIAVRPWINFSVGLFIFLAGYLTTYSLEKKTNIQSVGRKLLRVVVPYLIWSVIYTMYHGSYHTFLYSLLTGQCCAVFYYLLVYMQLVVVLPITIWLLRSKFSWVGFVVTPLAITIEYWLNLQGIAVIYPWNINNLFVWYTFFYLGMYLRNRTEPILVMRGRSQLYCWSVGLIGAIALEGLEATKWNEYGRYDMATTAVTLSSMLLTIMVCFFAYSWMMANETKLISNSKGILCLGLSLGQSSFGIYLIHSLVGEAMGQAFSVWYQFPRPIILLLEVFISWGIVVLGQFIFRKRFGRWIGFY